MRERRLERALPPSHRLVSRRESAAFLYSAYRTQSLSNILLYCNGSIRCSMSPHRSANGEEADASRVNRLVGLDALRSLSHLSRIQTMNERSHIISPEIIGSYSWRLAQWPVLPLSTHAVGRPGRPACEPRREDCRGPLGLIVLGIIAYSIRTLCCCNTDPCKKRWSACLVHRMIASLHQPEQPDPQHCCRTKVLPTTSYRQPHGIIAYPVWPSVE